MHLDLVTGCRVESILDVLDGPAPLLWNDPREPQGRGSGEALADDVACRPDSTDLSTVAANVNCQALGFDLSLYSAQLKTGRKSRHRGHPGKRRVQWAGKPGAARVTRLTFGSQDATT